MNKLLHNVTHSAKKCLTNDEGSISIYLIIVTLALFLFHAVLIDYARIMVAEKQTEQAVRAASRSILSSFDLDLQSYGLFAVEGDEQEILYEVMHANMALQEQHIFSFVDTRFEANRSIVTMERPLSDASILEHQILEEMKYRAPIEWSIEMLDKLAPFTEAMQEASILVHSSATIIDHVREREEALKKVEADQSLAHKLVMQDDVQSYIYGGGSALYPQVRNIAQFYAHDGAYREDIKRYKQLQQKEDMEGRNDLLQVDEHLLLKTRMSIYERNSHHMLSSLKSTLAAVEQKIQQAQEELITARQHNTQIEQYIEQYRNQSQEKYTAMNTVAGQSKADSHGLPLTNMEQNLSTLTNALDQYVLEEDFFIKLEEGLDQKGTELDRMLRFIDHLSSVIDGSIQSARTRIDDYHLRLIQSEQMLIGLFKQGSKLLEQRFERLISLEEWDELNQAEEQAEQEWQRTLADWTDAQQKIERWQGDQEAYDNLYTIMHKYTSSMAPVHANKLEEMSAQSHHAAAEMMMISDQIFAQFGQLMLNVRDELYVNEYTLHKLASRAPSHLTHLEDYLLEHREVEYVLFGQHVSAANYALSLASIFALRFVLNFVAYFFTEAARVSVHPLIAFFLASSYAFGHALRETIALSSGNQIPLLSHYPQYTLDYHDHLRFLMLLHPQKEARIMRMQAILEYRLDQDLQQRMTYVHVRATSSLRLWFIPEIARALDKVGVLNGRVKGNRYMFEVEGVSSY